MGSVSQVQQQGPPAKGQNCHFAILSPRPPAQLLVSQPTQQKTSEVGRELPPPPLCSGHYLPSLRFCAAVFMLFDPNLNVQTSLKQTKPTQLSCFLSFAPSLAQSLDSFSRKNITWETRHLTNGDNVCPLAMQERVLRWVPQRVNSQQGYVQLYIVRQLALFCEPTFSASYLSNSRVGLLKHQQAQPVQNVTYEVWPFDAALASLNGVPRATRR